MATRSAPKGGRQGAALPPRAEPRRQLVEQTAGFAGAYLRWIDATRDNGLSYPRLRLLEALHCSGPAMMRVVADQLRLSARNMTALVDSLEHEGLVVRRAHPTDRRALLLELTRMGVEASNAAFERRVEAIAELFDDLSPAQQHKLLEVTSALLGSLRRRGVRA